ncbi:hypothetical protein BDN71DRAFT_1457647, partial [Pleurotus eryngii]
MLLLCYAIPCFPSLLLVALLLKMLYIPSRRLLMLYKLNVETDCVYATMLVVETRYEYASMIWRVRYGCIQQTLAVDHEAVCLKSSWYLASGSVFFPV